MKIPGWLLGPAVGLALYQWRPRLWMICCIAALMMAVAGWLFTYTPRSHPR